MNKDRAQNYNEHATFMAEIANAILDGNKRVLDVSGVKEIIALYLMIPYISESTLQTPGANYIIPHLNGEFLNNIPYSELRNTICHSFVTVEEDNNDGVHGKYLIFDDRIITHKELHSKKGNHSEAYIIDIGAIHMKLKEMIGEITTKA